MTGSKTAVNLMDYMPTVSAKPTPPAGTKPTAKQPDPVALALFKAKYGL
jgi:hypothetical protein